MIPAQGHDLQVGMARLGLPIEFQDGRVLAAGVAHQDLHLVGGSGVPEDGLQAGLNQVQAILGENGHGHQVRSVILGRRITQGPQAETLFQMTPEGGPYRRHSSPTKFPEG